MTSHFWISLPVALICFYLRARFLGLKDALRNLSDAELKELAEKTSPKKIETLKRLRNDPTAPMSVLGAMTLSATAVGSAFAIYGTMNLLMNLISESATATKTDLRLGFWIFLSTLIAIAISGLLEAFFRTLAKRAPSKLVLQSAGFLTLTTGILFPPLALAKRLIRLSLRPFGIDTDFHSPHPSLEELERLLSEAAKGTGLCHQTPKLIHNIFEMNDRIARDIIVPRTKVIALDIATPPAEMVKLLSEQGHSRIPIYRNDIDNVVGILHVRDLVPMLQCPELIVIQDVIRPALFVPWSKPVGDFLRMMQTKRIHMAIVVDEYGGFLGVATLEDLLETIVGEIRNEYAAEGPEKIERLGDGTYRIRGEASVTLVEEKLGVRFAVDEPCETMAGLVSFISGCIPEVGERIFVGGCMLTVEERSARRVSRIRCQRVSIAPESAGISLPQH